MKIYKITEASEYLGVSINTLKTLANNGRKIVRKALIISAVVLLLGCAAIPSTPEERYSRMFSGSVGCPASEVKIVNIDTAITETTVLLECKGKRYYCTERRVGAAGTSCAEVR